ncbi:MAG: sulfurtransferase complex subunit TusB [Candidatus Thorarchaeota archaeon]|nr:MAG: sulfurtransferase complex subunit TusB [Candidatus Thorarchaeota archaeon]
MKYMILLSNECMSIKEVVTGLKSRNIEVELLLLQDGVYLVDKGNPESKELKELGLKVHALKHHVVERGIASRLAVDVDLVDYPSVVDLLMEKSDKVISL